VTLSKFFIFTTITLISTFAVLAIIYIREPNKLQEKPAQIITTQKDALTLKAENLYWENVTTSATWEPRDSGETFLFQNKIWLIGGLNGNIETGQNNVIDYSKMPHFNDIWNTEDGINWTQAATSSAWAPRRSMSVVKFNNKLWMFGGWSPITGYSNDIWTSEDGINWTKTVESADWPVREGQTAEVFQNKIWLIGGVNYDKRKTKNDVWYSEDGINWKKAEYAPWRSRWDHATTVFNGKLFLIGGMDLAGRRFNDVWAMNDGLTWTRMTNNVPWQARQGHVLESYKGKLWLIGRFNNARRGEANDVWFSGDGIIWNKTANDPLWSGREDFFSAVFKDKIWIFGGMDTNWQWQNDVWASNFLML